MSGLQEPSFQIGTRHLGPGRPPYIIAEAGVCHDGEPEVAARLIEAAASAGVDAVKFQVFSADRLVTRSAPAADYQRKAIQVSTQYQMLKDLELSHAAFEDLAGQARDIGLDFIATPFSIEDLAFLIKLEVPAIKIASPDLVNTPMLRKAAESHAPVIVSTGAADLEEIREAVELFDDARGDRLALLHCVSSYPTADSEANLLAVRQLARRFDRVTGFSDHTESIEMGAHAILAGAAIVEKHVTLSRDRQGPDHSFALEPAMLIEYVCRIREATIHLGSGSIGPTPAQREIRDLARSSVVASRDIRAGEHFSRDMLTVKRPGSGIPAGKLDQVIGARALADIACDAQLNWEQIETSA